MHNPIKAACGWLADAIMAKLTAPFDRINARLDTLEALHGHDAAALECDLSIMDDRICFLIGVCRRRGYTTADERRRITRMHDAYRARGGNHGEENEYKTFLHLPTQEEYERMMNEEDKQHED